MAKTEVVPAARNSILRFLFVLGACALILISACGRRAPAATPGAPPPAPTRQYTPPTVIYSGNSGGIRDSLRVVIRSESELANYWQRATALQSSPPPVERVDFNREMVILVAAGRKTSEARISVDTLLVRKELKASNDREDTLIILVRKLEGCGRFQNEAYPLQMVRVLKFDGPFRFEDQIAKPNCGTQDEPEPAQ